MGEGFVKKQTETNKINVIKSKQANGNETKGCYIYLPNITQQEANALVVKILKEYMEEKLV